MQTRQIIKNKTYFHSPITPTENVIPTQSSFSHYMARRKDVFQRLYAEHKHTLSLHGMSLFYTLTYSDLRIPHFFGRNFHDYRHLQWLFNSCGFVKILNRRFNTSLKYCVCSEYGEGHGERGYHQNPHYHCVFFLTPIDISRPMIDSGRFMLLIKSFWQGTTISKPTFEERLKHSCILTDKNLMHFGFATPGDKLGVISNPAALLYVVKYVTKDKVARDVETSFMTAIDDYYNKLDCLQDSNFVNSVLDNFVSACTDLYDTISSDDVSLYGRQIYKVFPNEYLDFVRIFAKDMYVHDLHVYRKFYRLRFRASQCLGYSVFTSSDFDIINATIQSVQCDKEHHSFKFKKEKITGQLYRAWFYRVEKHEVFSPTLNKKILQNFYRPNGNLLQYQITHIGEVIHNTSNYISDRLTSLSDHIVYEQFFSFVKSSYNSADLKNILPYAEYIELHNDVVNRLGRDELVRRLAMYHIIYRGRSIFADSVNDIDYERDYAFFSRHAYYLQFKEINYLGADYSQLNLVSYENSTYFACCMDLYKIYLLFCDFLEKSKSERYFQEVLNQKQSKHYLYAQGFKRTSY